MEDQNKTSFTYQVKLEGTLTRDEADMIYNHMLQFIDTKRYTKQGTFGFTFVNIYKGQDVEREWTSHEIDIMLKSLEYPYLDIDKKLKGDIIIKLHQWVGLIQKEYLRIKGTPIMIGMDVKEHGVAYQYKGTRIPVDKVKGMYKGGYLVEFDKEDIKVTEDKINEFYGISPSAYPNAWMELYKFIMKII